MAALVVNVAQEVRMTKKEHFCADNDEVDKNDASDESSANKEAIITNNSENYEKDNVVANTMKLIQTTTTIESEVISINNESNSGIALENETQLNQEDLDVSNNGY